jgi:hypothetical protein
MRSMRFSILMRIDRPEWIFGGGHCTPPWRRKSERGFRYSGWRRAVFLYRRIDSSVEIFISIGQDENDAARILVASLSINRADEFVREEGFLGDKEDS